MYREKGQPTYRSIVSDSKMQTLAGKAKQDNKTEELTFNPKFSFVFCKKKNRLVFSSVIFSRRICFFPDRANWHGSFATPTTLYYSVSGYQICECEGRLVTWLVMNLKPNWLPNGIFCEFN